MENLMIRKIYRPRHNTNKPASADNAKKDSQQIQALF